MTDNIAQFLYAHMVSAAHLDGRNLSDKTLLEMRDLAIRAERIFLLGPGALAVHQSELTP